MAELAEIGGEPRRRILSRRRTITAAIVLAFVLALLPWVLIRAQTWTDVGPVAGHFRHADAALVLGARVYSDGTASPFLRERVATGVRLYQGGYVDRLILSGDGNDSSGFGEPAVMRAVAEGMGVPSDAIVEDPLGLDTYSSCARAQSEFGAGSVIIATQEFHVSRAVWLCDRAGIKTQGAYPPVTLRKATVVGNGREFIADVKAWMDVVTRARALGTPST